MPIKIEIEGLDKVRAAIEKFPEETKKRFKVAGQDVSKLIFDVPGLKNYPPAGAGNSPGRTDGKGRPMGYYNRGIGYVSANGKQYKTSQRLGSKTMVTRKNTTVKTGWYEYADGLSDKIGTNVTYAPYVVGDQQAGWAKAVGWRNLYEVVDEKITEIAEVYQRHIKNMIRALDLD